MHSFRKAIAKTAAAAGIPEDEACAAVTVPRERERADLSLPCFTFAKALRKSPAAIAAEVAAAFAPTDRLEAAEAAGPFVNFRVNRSAWAAELLERLETEGEAWGGTDAAAAEPVVVEYGSPNIAKPLLFHHLRSSVIGQALANLMRHRGHPVVSLNFLGDVGTAFGKLMVGIEELGEAKDADALNRTYVEASKLCADDPERMDRARAWAKRLEQEDAEAVRLWTEAREISLAGFRRVYDRLGVRYDKVDGEQMYVKRAQAFVERLLKDGRARVSEGAVVLDPADESLGVVVLRKGDGTTLYQTRDLVAAIDRHEQYGFASMNYVVDVAQELHFKQLFSGLAALGYAWAERCMHVAFGQVLMGGRRTATREGRGVLLEEVLDEAVRRAAAIIAEKNPDLADRERVAEAVGVGAVIFSDLGTQIRRNVDFEWEQVLSFDGRTGPYLQYAHASACSILRKGGEPVGGDASLLQAAPEWELVRRMTEFPNEVERACTDREPSIVAAFLYELAREFRAYHAAGGKDRALRVLCDDDGLRAARLRLVAGVRATLRIGLALLGLEPLEEM